jgi:hypothetical protein
MFSDRFPFILSFMYKHTTWLGACCFQFNAKKGRFFARGSDRKKCLASFLIFCSYTVFAIVRTINAKLSSSPDFAMCYASILGFFVVGGAYLVVLGYTSDVNICVAFTLLYRSCIRFKSK